MRGQQGLHQLQSFKQRDIEAGFLLLQRFEILRKWKCSLAVCEGWMKRTGVIGYRCGRQRRTVVKDMPQTEKNCCQRYAAGL